MKYLLPKGCGSVAILTMVMFFGIGCASQELEQETFASPDGATDALVRALREQSTDQLKQILGSEADEILASGDEVADQNAAERFIKAYEEKHQLVRDGDDYVTLVVGNADWPMPIPLVREDDNRWRFDSEAGKDEIINRRIGRNELDVIQVCQAIVDAQREYASAPGGVAMIRGEFAQKFVSDEGKKNGLYWPTAEGEAASPLGPLVAEAVEEGYTASRGAANQPRPFHGYCYRMLKSQGPNAAGGQRDYIVDGKMTGGFAVIAYPAEYGNSGIMTFMVNQQGVVYQKDLGDDTEISARAMQSFDPGAGWEPIATDAPGALVGAP